MPPSDFFERAMRAGGADEMLELDDFIKSFRREADEDAARRIPAVLDELEAAALRGPGGSPGAPSSSVLEGEERGGHSWSETGSEGGDGTSSTDWSGDNAFKGGEGGAESGSRGPGREDVARPADGGSVGAALHPGNFHEHPRIRELIEQYEYAIDALNKDRTMLKQEVQRVNAVEKERERVVLQDREERLAIKAELELLKARMEGGLSEEGGAEASQSQQQERHLSREDLERLAKVDAQTDELHGEFQMLRKILDVGQSVVEDFSEEKDSAMASLRREIEEMREEAKRLQADARAGTPTETHERVVRENDILRRDLQNLQAEHQSTKRRFLLEQRERLERLEADAEITRGESEENAYRVANLEQEKESLEASLVESRKKVAEIREDAAKAAEASARLQQARENTFEAQMKTNQKCIENLEELLEKERREAEEAKERLARSGSVQLELETVNRKLVEGAVRTSDIEKAMQAKINDAVAKFEKKCRDNDAALSQVEEHKQQLRVAKSQVENLREEKKVAAEEQRVAQAAIVEALKARDCALRDTAALGESMQFQKEEFAAELSALKGDVWALRTKHESAMQLFDSTRIEMDQAKNDIETFCSEYANTRDTLVRGAMERVNTVRAEMRAVFQASQKEVEALRLSHDVVKSKMEDDLAKKTTEFEDFKYKSHMSVLKMEGTLEKLTTEKEEIQAKMAQQLLEFEGEKDQAQEKFQRQLDLKQEENKILMKKREHNAQEHTTLMSELKAKFQEVMDLKSEFDQRRRKMEQENSDLERQLFLVTKDREESLSKFRIERNAWSEKLREAKLSTAKEEAQLRGRLTELESERTALTNKVNRLQLQVTKLEVEASKEEEVRMYALGQGEAPRSNEVPEPWSEPKGHDAMARSNVEKENYRPHRGLVAWDAQDETSMNMSDHLEQKSRGVTMPTDAQNSSMRSRLEARQDPTRGAETEASNAKWATRTGTVPPESLDAPPPAGAMAQRYTDTRPHQYPSTIVAPRTAAGIVAAAQNPMSIPGFVPRVNPHAYGPQGGYYSAQHSQHTLSVFNSGRGSAASYTSEYLGSRRPTNLPVAESTQPGVAPYDAAASAALRR